MTNNENQKRFEQFFKDYDKNNKGYIDIDDIAVLLENYYKHSDCKPTNQDINEYALKFRQTKEDKISKEKFVDIMTEINA